MDGEDYTPEPFMKTDVPVDHKPPPCHRGKCNGSGWVYEDRKNTQTGQVESIRFQCECRAADEFVGGA